MKQELIDRVIDEIIKDISQGDLTAIEGMLSLIPSDILIEYLPEEEWKKFNNNSKPKSK